MYYPPSASLSQSGRKALCRMVAQCYMAAHCCIGGGDALSPFCLLGGGDVLSPFCLLEVGMYYPHSASLSQSGRTALCRMVAQCYMAAQCCIGGGDVLSPFCLQLRIPTGPTCVRMHVHIHAPYTYLGIRMHAHIHWRAYLQLHSLHLQGQRSTRAAPGPTVELGIFSP